MVQSVQLDCGNPEIKLVDWVAWFSLIFKTFYKPPVLRIGDMKGNIAKLEK
jgi:hypothetical protein